MDEHTRQLLTALQDIYDLEAFSDLAEMLQGESLVLHFLLTAGGGPVCPSDLSPGLHLSRSRITAAVGSLHRKGLVSTAPDPADRRRVLVSLTEPGQRVITEKRARLEGYFDTMIAGLGPADADELTRLIRRCVAIMGGNHA